MVNPQLLSKEPEQLTLSREAKNLFRVLFNAQNKKEVNKNEEKLVVSDLISKMSFYYEKIRNSVDYKEENLLRKDAVERILKREIVIQGSIKIAEVKSEDVARHLLVELIRAGYLPNNEIPKRKIKDIARLINKYLLLRKYALENVNSLIFFSQKKTGTHEDEMKTRGEIINWIIAVAASDIENNLEIDEVGKVIVHDMFEIVSNSVKLPNSTEYQEDLDIQIYLSIYRNYLKYDDNMLSFILLKYYVSGWNEADEELIKKTGRTIGSLKRAIDHQLYHGLAPQINRIVNRYTVFFSILKDVIRGNPEEIYNEIKKDPKSFPRLIKNVCEKRYKNAKTRLWRAALRSIIYIFITKSIFVFLLEIPATAWFGEDINTTALAINIAFPAALLFLAVLFTKLPSEDNSSKIVEGISRIMFEDKRDYDQYDLKRPSKRGGIMNFIFNILYTITFFLSFGFIIWGLDKLSFNWVSIVIFLFFLAFVSFFTIRIRRNTKELLLVEPKESLFSFFTDFFYVPIISVGKWLSEKFSKINLFVFVLDFIIEAPFKIFVEIAEEWTKYVRERKDEIR